MPKQPYFHNIQDGTETESVFRAYFPLDASAESINTVYFGELPDWNNQAQMSHLALQNPKTYTIRQVRRKEPEEYKIKFEFTGTDWLFWFIIVTLALLSWLRISFGKIISNTLSASLSMQDASRMLRERNSLNIRVSLGLNILFAFNSGLFFYQVGNHYSFIPKNIEGQWIALIIFVSIALIYLVKEVLLRILGYVADIANPISEYINIVSINNKVLGMIILPVIIGLQYTQSDFIPAELFVFIGLGLFVLFYLIRIFRGIIISLRHSVSLFYSFLYLCTLEIAPMLFIYTIATSL